MGDLARYFVYGAFGRELFMYDYSWAPKITCSATSDPSNSLNDKGLFPKGKALLSLFHLLFYIYVSFNFVIFLMNVITASAHYSYTCRIGINTKVNILNTKFNLMFSLS